MSRYCIATPRPAGLVFGFGAFAEPELDKGIQTLAGVLDGLAHPSTGTSASARPMTSPGRTPRRA